MKIIHIPASEILELEIETDGWAEIVRFRVLQGSVSGLPESGRVDVLVDRGVETFAGSAVIERTLVANGKRVVLLSIRNPVVTGR